MEKKLVVGNIGMMFGMAHVEGAMHYGAEVAAICDLNEKNLRAAGEKYNIPVELITKLIVSVDTNKHITRNNKMQKAFDQIIGQGWLHYDAVEGVLENDN